ncbi:MAG: Sporulation kinase [Planctomycetota bacterium]
MVTAPAAAFVRPLLLTESLTVLDSVSALLGEPAPWAVQAERAGEYWVRCGNATAVLFLGVRSGGGFEAVSIRQRADGQLTHDRLLVAGSPAWLLSNNRLMESAAATGHVSGLGLAVYRWPELLSAAIVQSGETPHPQLDTPSAESIAPLLTKQLLTRAADRGLLIPDENCLEAIAEYAAGAGHEINNPLASIIGQTQVLLRSDQQLERRQAYETIGAQAWRVRDIIGNSMLFARPPQPARQPLNLIHSVQESLSALQSLAAEHHVEFRLSANAEELTIHADRSLLGQMISSLLRNAIEAIRSSNRPGKVAVEVRQPAPDAVAVSIRDTGPGLSSAEIRRHLFNPFFSGRPAGRGLGFGLSLAWRITRLHGGLIFAEEPADGGLSIEFALPV